MIVAQRNLRGDGKVGWWGSCTYAARNIQRHCVQYVIATRGRFIGAVWEDSIFIVVVAFLWNVNVDM
jgi:hypothetical protein